MSDLPYWKADGSNAAAIKAAGACVVGRPGGTPSQAKDWQVSEARMQELAAEIDEHETSQPLTIEWLRKHMDLPCDKSSKYRAIFDSGLHRIECLTHPDGFALRLEHNNRDLQKAAEIRRWGDSRITIADAIEFLKMVGVPIRNA